MEEDTIPVEKPIGAWILEQNISGTQTHNGVYYHYSEVCSLLKLMKKECEGQTVNQQNKQLKCQCKKAQFTRNVDADFNPLCGRCGKAI